MGFFPSDVSCLSELAIIILRGRYQRKEEENEEEEGRGRKEEEEEEEEVPFVFY